MRNAYGPKIGVAKMRPLPMELGLGLFIGVSRDLVLHCSEGIELPLGVPGQVKNDLA